ncbi:hypothetical protein [Priestia megaterium]
MAKEALVDEIMIADFYPDQASQLKGDISYWQKNLILELNS